MHAVTRRAPELSPVKALYNDWLPGGPDWRVGLDHRLIASATPLHPPGSQQSTPSDRAPARDWALSNSVALPNEATVPSKRPRACSG